MNAKSVGRRVIIMDKTDELELSGKWRTAPEDNDELWLPQRRKIGLKETDELVLPGK